MRQPQPHLNSHNLISLLTMQQQRNSQPTSHKPTRTQNRNLKNNRTMPSQLPHQRNTNSKRHLHRLSSLRLLHHTTSLPTPHTILKRPQHSHTTHSSSQPQHHTNRRLHISPMHLHNSPSHSQHRSTLHSQQPTQRHRRHHTRLPRTTRTPSTKTTQPRILNRTTQRRRQRSNLIHRPTIPIPHTNQSHQHNIHSQLNTNSLHSRTKPIRHLRLRRLHSPQTTHTMLHTNNSNPPLPLPRMHTHSHTSLRQRRSLPQQLIIQQRNTNQTRPQHRLQPTHQQYHLLTIRITQQHTSHKVVPLPAAKWKTRSSTSPNNRQQRSLQQDHTQPHTKPTHTPHQTNTTRTSPHHTRNTTTYNQDNQHKGPQRLMPPKTQQHTNPHPPTTHHNQLQNNQSRHNQVTKPTSHQTHRQ